MADAFMESLADDPDRPHVVVNPHTGQSGVLLKRDDSANYDRTATSDGDDCHYTVAEVWGRIVYRA